MYLLSDRTQQIKRNVNNLNIIVLDLNVLRWVLTTIILHVAVFDLRVVTFKPIIVKFQIRV